MQEVFGLIDCNNFYVSCERVFRPDLEGVPVAAGPKDSAWKLRAEHRSPRWTTRWGELPHVTAT